MKIKTGFMLRKVAGQYMVVPVGEAGKLLNGMIQLNETGAFLWELLISGASKEELAERLEKEYGITKEQAIEDLERFLEVLNSVGCLE